MAEKENETEEAGGGGKKKLILIIVGALLLVGISVGVTLMFLGGGEEEVVSEEDLVPEKGPAVYTELDPFTVNLDPSDPVSYLRVEVRILSHFEEVTEQLEKHKPLIRNDLTVLFAQQKSTDLRTEDGKKKLQAAMLEKIQASIARYGKGGEVSNAYFVNFVMQ